MTRSASTTTASAAGAPDHVGWVSCPDCGWLLYRKRLDRNLHVCPECDHHLRLSARARIVLLTDPGSFTEVALDRKSTHLNSSHANISYAVFCLKKKKRRFPQSSQKTP